MACVRTRACRGGSLAQLAPGRLPRGGPRVGAGVLEKHSRAARRIPRGSSSGSAGCQPPPWMRDSAAQGRVRDTSAPAVAPAKNGASKKRRGLAPKKRAPPSLCASGRLVKQKIILSSVVATSTFYARTRVRSRLHTQLFEKIVKIENVVKSQQ